MTPRNLFNIILKIFGLFFIREIIWTIPQLVLSFTQFMSPEPYEVSRNYSGALLTLFTFILIITYYFLIILLLLFRTNKVIDKLKLDKGFNQPEFSFEFSSSNILAIALIIIGGFILINEIPNLLRNIFSYYQDRSLSRGVAKVNYSSIILPAVKIILGLLIIGERKRIVAFTERMHSKKADME